MTGASSGSSRIEISAGGSEPGAATAAPPRSRTSCPTHVVTVTADATIRQAANLMRGRGIGCLAIVADDKPVGIVTITDLLELIGRGVERPIERSKRWTLSRRGARDAGPGTRHARRS